MHESIRTSRRRTQAALNKELKELLKAHFGLRMQTATQQLTNTSAAEEGAPRHRARARPSLSEKAKPEMNAVA